MTTALLLIDVQNDFVDSPNFNPSLGVPGSYQDMLRIVSHIETQNPDAIFVTLDTHQKMDIAHPAWWVDKQGNNPSPFTIITEQDLLDGKWQTANPSEKEYSLQYVKTLSQQGKYQLCVWPYHVIKGTRGHDVVEVVQEALNKWETMSGKKVVYVEKGTNPRTEHYSGFKAEVVLSEDPGTELNRSLISKLDSFDSIHVAGEALSHCVGSSLMDLMDNVLPEKVFVLANCCSSVPGFEQQGHEFLNKVLNKGGTLLNVTSLKNKHNI